MSFENLEVWKRGCRQSVRLYKQLNDLENWSFRDQITRAGLSIRVISRKAQNAIVRRVCTVPSYREGFLWRANDTALHGIEAGFIDHTQGLEWVQENKEIGAMLGGLIRRNKK